MASEQPLDTPTDLAGRPSQSSTSQPVAQDQANGTAIHLTTSGAKEMPVLDAEGGEQIAGGKQGTDAVPKRWPLSQLRKSPEEQGSSVKEKQQRERIHALEDQNDELREQLQLLKVEQVTLTTEVDSLKHQNQSLKEMIHSQAATIKETRKRKRTLEDQLEDQGLTHASTSPDELQQARARVEALENTLTEERLAKEEATKGKASSEQKITELEAQLRRTKYIAERDLHSPLDVTNSSPEAESRRDATLCEVLVPERTTPFQDRLDPRSFVNGRQFKVYLPPDQRSNHRLFSIMYCHMIEHIDDGLHEETVNDRCVDLLWDLWGNLQNSSVPREQISVIVQPLASALERVLASYAQGNLPDLAFWLATQIILYLRCWKFAGLEIKMPDLPNRPGPGRGSLVAISRAGYAESVRLGLLEKAPPITFYRVDLAADSKTSLGDTFDVRGRLNDQTVAGSVIYLPDDQQVLCALIIRQNGCFLWQGPSECCKVVSNGLSAWLRLDRGEVDACDWLSDQVDVCDWTRWTHHRFEEHDLQPEEEDLLNTLSDD
ncbi:MAG: hypothetical protein Q9219_003515 [cf. Caloplaca sp. 3 TL-2023]